MAVSPDLMIWWGLLILLPVWTGINAVHFFRLSAKSGLETVKKYYLWIAVFMLMLTFCGFIDVWYAYYQRILGNPGVDPLPHLATEGGTYFFLITTFLMFSFLALTRTVEKYIKQSEKTVLTYIMLIGFILSLIPYVTPPDVTDQLALIVYGAYIPFTFMILYWGVFYLKLAGKSEGIIKKRANQIAFGLGMTFIGIAGGLATRDFAPLIAATGYLFPIGFAVVGNLGELLLLFGFKQD